MDNKDLNPIQFSCGGTPINAPQQDRTVQLDDRNALIAQIPEPVKKALQDAIKGLDDKIKDLQDQLDKANANKPDINNVFNNGGGVPKFGIIMWDRNVKNVPNGFWLCDGTHGTIDYRGSYLVVAGKNNPEAGKKWIFTPTATIQPGAPMGRSIHLIMKL